MRLTLWGTTVPPKKKENKKKIKKANNCLCICIMRGAGTGGAGAAQRACDTEELDEGALTLSHTRCMG